MKKLKNILIATFLILTFILVVFFVVTRIQGGTPRIFGYQILRISSGSMSPELEVGDIILSKKVDDASTLKSGDVITYIGELGSYADKNITHKVIVDPYEIDGTYYLRTQGIANDYIDPEISEDQILGKMVCILPFLGALYNFFITPFGLIIVLAILALLFINEILNLKRIVKDPDNTDSENDDFAESAKNSEIKDLN